jgi:alpha-D-xyloside xylohydrolase
LFGDDFLVAPIYKDQLSAKVTLPEGNWRYFFSDKEIIKGPVTIEREFPLDEFPVFVREGAIIPLDIKRDYTGLGDKNSEGYLILLIYPESKNEFTVHHPDKSGSTTISVENNPENIRVLLSGISKPHVLNIAMNQAPKKVELDGIALSDSVNYHFDQAKNKLIIKTNQYSTGQYLIQK